ncbi:hypothetical protein [Nonomuraea gerenzanensis]|nr:hypothetical protein [Nonomuraea gerenzanensis]UBU16313.1 hypothetical protein LCN96_15240 [Nonomuraea gerenzanensis]
MRKLVRTAPVATVAGRGNYLAGCGLVENLLRGGLTLDAVMTCRASDEFH